MCMCMCVCIYSSNVEILVNKNSVFVHSGWAVYFILPQAAGRGSPKISIRPKRKENTWEVLDMVVMSSIVLSCPVGSKNETFSEA